MVGRDAVRQRVREVVSRFPEVDRAIRKLRRTDQVRSLQAELADARLQLAAVLPANSEQSSAGTSASRFVTWTPPGHFYSPVPSWSDVERFAHQVFANPADLPGLELRPEEQLAMFEELAQLAAEVPPPGDGPGRFEQNSNYGAADAPMLQSMLRKLRPKRYVEVGSGWSTVLAVDTNEMFLGNSMRITTIDPFPELVRRLLPESGVEIVGVPVQEAPAELFAQLEAGDVLFLDSSHVVKAASDVHHLVTRVLPALPDGVYVHIHDIFWPFDYPRTWLEEGRAWNEAYILHAFLLFNTRFHIALFTDWIARQHRGRIEQLLPAMLGDRGGSLWLRVGQG